ncbi:hypothetical protein QR674_00420 [Acinetobacter chinensis]|uniref:Uncharacterized protein n=1 Tax=Acinetobacter chinensis TaxID=2004650 RepID=A0ABU3WBL6_9GAMM|nr:hypothetical protein [Acinetobacter chinensis]MDV2467453.1 hypothetical protein [Acinetobacter chinensis]
MSRTDIKRRPLSDIVLADLEPELNQYRLLDPYGLLLVITIKDQKDWNESRTVLKVGIGTNKTEFISKFNLPGRKSSVNELTSFNTVTNLQATSFSRYR